MSDTQAWIIKVIALGVPLILVLWAISMLRQGPSLSSELPTQPIPAKVQTGD
jgi:hypothetical protein